MNTHRLLVTGASGFLGWNIARYYASHGWDVTGIWNSTRPDPDASARYIQADLLHVDLTGLFKTLLPEAVVHCAALASRAACDADQPHARSINTELPLRIAAQCADRDIPFFQISTDLVFDGCGAPYGEHTKRNPLSVYAETKSNAEDAVMSVYPKSYIIRTALMYGLGPFSRPGSFLQWTLDALREGKPLHLYVNQYRTILHAPDVARVIEAITERKAVPGVYHAAGPERVSRYEAGLRIAKEFGYSDECIVPVVLERSEELSCDDDVSLDTTWTRDQTGIQFTSLEAGLRAVRIGMI